MISIICAMDEKRGIGKNGKIPWYIHEDMVRFREITSSHPIIMGRKTFESIGRLLPNRANIIITHNSSFMIQGAVVAGSLEKAIEIAKREERNKYSSSEAKRSREVTMRDSSRQARTIRSEEEIFIIGGGQIYAQAIGMADKLYLTIVEGTYDADTFFPDYSAFKKVVFKEEHQSDGYKYTFLDIER